MMLASCGEDRTHEYIEKTQENQWIYSTMKEVYLWADEIKSPERTEFFGTTSKFFSSLLSTEDKVSFFSDSIQTASYGLTYAIMRDPIGEKPSRYYALALYVEPGSSAEIAGIERGTWISAIDGKALSSSSGKQLETGGSVTIATSFIDYDDDNGKYLWVTGDTLTMPAALEFKSEAIYLDTTFVTRSGKIGYIVCSNLNGDSFTDEIGEIMLTYAAEDISDMIIDLRYCQGGSMENAAVLASILVPASLTGTPFASLQGRDKNTLTTYAYSNQTVNISDKRMFFITGKATEGIAELLVESVNASRGMHEVVIVGEQSAGANLLVEKYDSPYGFSINPAIAVMCASDGTPLTTQGVEPDHVLNELEEPEQFFGLGNEQEYILRNIEYLIANGSLPAEM